MIAGLVLAAGESSRMGRDKALLDYRGKTFLETIVTALRDAGIEKIAVVLGHHAEEIQSAAQLENCEVVINKDFAQGQTSSLQSGLKSLFSESLEAAVLCLVDHPAVKSTTIAKLIEAFHKSSAPVVIPTYQGKRGHPVLIGHTLLDELAQLTPGEGANAVIRSHYPEAIFVETADPGVVLDVDNPKDYREVNSENR